MFSSKINKFVSLDRLGLNGHFAIEMNPDKSGTILITEIL